MDKQKFYFKGVFFDSEIDFFKFFDIYEKSQVTQNSLDEKFKDMARDFFENIDVHKVKISNAQMDDILQYYFFEIIGELINNEKLK